jgi:glycerol kinase
VRCLRVDGGLARSRVVLQAQADLLQRRVEVYPSPDATAIGVAALARLGTGIVPTARAAVGRWSPTAVYEPTIDGVAAAERLARWRRVAQTATCL